ncbi:MAG: nucleoside deaminase [Bacilli bacterium]|nr:nucleoside deaminase [Bacilli bacterium]
MEQYIKYMELAYKEAKKAEKTGEVPVGAIIVKNNKVISKGYNKNNKSNLTIDHAEIIAISKANKKIKNWRLSNCDMYVTLEPCLMCKTVIINSRIKNVYFSSYNKSVIVEKNKELNLSSDVNFIYVDGFVKCSEIIKEFFLKKRNK